MDITVVIPTYNRYTLLKRAILSVYAQTSSVKEIIIVDDGSTDNTKNIVDDFPNIIYFYQENRGVSAARNIGIKRAKNEWIAFLDSDDEWHKDKILKQIEFHKKNSDILMSYTDEVWIRNGVEKKIPKKFKKIGKDAFFENLSYCNIAPSSAILHQSLFVKVGLFDENLRVCEDYDLWLRVASEYTIGLINQKLIRKYAGHDNQLGFQRDLDKFRIITLEKILDLVNQEKRESVIEQLIIKYTLLKKGAMKYDRITDISSYTKKLTILKAMESKNDL